MHRRFGPFDAAVVPIGTYDPRIRHRCTPEQAVTMADAAGARVFVPVHHRISAVAHRADEHALRDERDRLRSVDRQTIVVPT